MHAQVSQTLYNQDFIKKKKPKPVHLCQNKAVGIRDYIFMEPEAEGMWEA